MTSAAAGGALTDAVPPTSGVVVGCGGAGDDTGEGGGGELACVVDWVLVCELDGVVVTSGALRYAQVEQVAARAR